MNLINIFEYTILSSEFLIVFIRTLSRLVSGRNGLGENEFDSSRQQPMPR